MRLFFDSARIVNFDGSFFSPVFDIERVLFQIQERSRYLGDQGPHTAILVCPSIHAAFVDFVNEDMGNRNAPQKKIYLYNSDLHPEKCMLLMKVSLSCVTYSDANQDAHCSMVLDCKFNTRFWKYFEGNILEQIEERFLDAREDHWDGLGFGQRNALTRYGSSTQSDLDMMHELLPEVRRNRRRHAATPLSWGVEGF